MRPRSSATTTASGSPSRRAGAAMPEVGTRCLPLFRRSTVRRCAQDRTRNARIRARFVDMSPCRLVDCRGECDCQTAPVTTSGERAMDLNADLGEGFGVWRLGDDDALLGVVTSANVACGFHAGDPAIMRRVCGQAAARGIAVGAQVSYRDLAGFGRRFIDVEPDRLTDDLLYQLAAL